MRWRSLRSRSPILTLSLCGQRISRPLSIRTDRVAGLYAPPGEISLGRSGESGATQTVPRCGCPKNTGHATNAIKNALAADFIAPSLPGFGLTTDVGYREGFPSQPLPSQLSCCPITWPATHRTPAWRRCRLCSRNGGAIQSRGLGDRTDRRLPDSGASSPRLDRSQCGGDGRKECQNNSAPHNTPSQLRRTFRRQRPTAVDFRSLRQA